jgi:hypothetical protein
VVLTALAAILGRSLAEHLLGTDGHLHHGRPVRRHGAPLLVVPALYSLWFRVRSDGADVRWPQWRTGRAVRHELEPIRLAAE